MSVRSIRRGISRGIPTAVLLAATSLLSAPGAQAQSAADPMKRADPLDPNVPVPLVSHQSGLMAYRRNSNEQPVSWSKANETVNRIGGWRSYARESQQAQPAAPVPPASQAPAAASNKAQDHGAHKRH
jgi:hypothetical protein